MVTFYKPSSKQFSTIDLTKADTQNYSEAALTFVDFLLDCEDVSMLRGQDLKDMFYIINSFQIQISNPNFNAL